MSDFLIGSIIMSIVSIVLTVWSNRSFQKFYREQNIHVQKEREAHQKTIENYNASFVDWFHDVDHRLKQLEPPQ